MTDVAWNFVKLFVIYLMKCTVTAVFTFLVTYFQKQQKKVDELYEPEQKTNKKQN